MSRILNVLNATRPPIGGTAGQAALAGSALTSLGNVFAGLERQRVRQGAGFNISSFSARVSKLGGLATSSNFLVSITAPPFLRNRNLELEQPGGANVPQVNFREGQIGTAAAVDNLIFLCGAAAIPGVQIQTTDINPYGYGAIERRPTSPYFNLMTLNFYLDVDSSVYRFFTRWINNVINFNDKAVATKTADDAFYNEVQYKSEYATTVDIYVYDPAGNNFLEVKLVDAFPVELGQVNLSWGNYNTLAVVPVRLSYTNWTSNYTPVAQVSASALRNLTLSSALLRAGTLVQGASTLLRRPGNTADVFNLVNNASLLRNTLFR